LFKDLHAEVQALFDALKDGDEVRKIKFQAQYLIPKLPLRLRDPFRYRIHLRSCVAYTKRNRAEITRKESARKALRPKRRRIGE